MKRVLIFILTMVTVTSVFADTEWQRTIVRLGLQRPDTAYFSIQEPVGANPTTAGCKYGNIYFNNDTTTSITTGNTTNNFGKAAYSALLAAKVSGRMLSRIDYTKAPDPDNTCTLDLIEIQD